VCVCVYVCVCVCARVTCHLEALIEEAHPIIVMTLQAVHFGCQCSSAISTLTFCSHHVWQHHHNNACIPMKVLFTHTHATLVKQSNTKLLVNISQCQLSSSANIVLLQ